MPTLPKTELAKITYLNPDAIDGRTLLMMPFWDGFTWHMWTEAPPGKILEMRVVDAVHSNYVAKHRARETDIWIQFVDHMWQRANWPDVARTILSIGDDFHLLATSIAKLKHFFDAQNIVDPSLMSSFVKSELEYLVTVARSVFDLLQDALSTIWNSKITLDDPASEAIRKRHKLPDSFTKMALRDRFEPKTIEEMTAKYAIPTILAEQYVRFAPFYASLLAARDSIIHRGQSVRDIYVTEKGFGVDAKGKPFSDFNWQSKHHYNDNVVSLLPWVANIVFGTLEACNDIMGAFASVFIMPPEIAPGFHIFIRDPANEAIVQLGKVASGEVIWWSDAPASATQAAGSPPVIVDKRA